MLKRQPIFLETPQADGFKTYSYSKSNHCTSPLRLVHAGAYFLVKEQGAVHKLRHAKGGGGGGGEGVRTIVTVCDGRGGGGG